MSDVDRARRRKMQAASYFLDRASEAIDAADQARTEDASSAYYLEAETWLFMASQCLSPASEITPPPSMAPASRVAKESRSFSRDD